MVTSTTNKRTTSTRKVTKATPIDMEEQQVVVAEEPKETNVQKTVGIIAVDNGGDNTKVFSDTMENPISFKSGKARGSVEDLEDPIVGGDSHSFIIEWKGKIYLTNYRMKQGAFVMSGNKKSKANDYFILSILVAVAKYGYDINYVQTSVPYENFTTKEIESIRNILIGEHSLRIDHEDYDFEIADVDVIQEAQAGHYYLEHVGRTTLLEIGSRTVGFATNEIVTDDEGNIIDEKHLRIKSGTLQREGLEIRNLKDDEYEAYAEHIYAKISKIIDEDDRVIAFGGGILKDEIKDGLAHEFNNIVFAEDPLFVQVRGMLNYAISPDVFGFIYNDTEDDDVVHEQ